MTKDFYRVLVFQFTKECPENYNPTLVISFTTGVYELRYMEDISLGVSFIVDFSNITLTHVFKITPILLKKLAALCEVFTHKIPSSLYRSKIVSLLQNAYCDRQKSCHIIYCGAGADTVVSIIMAGLKPKLRERVCNCFVK